MRDGRRHGDRVGPVVPRQAGNVGRKTQRDGGHVPRDVADVVAAAALRVHDWSVGFARERGVEAARGLAELALNTAGQGLVLVVPFRHADALDVLEHLQLDRFAEVAVPRAAEDPHGVQLCARHHGRGARDRVGEGEEGARALVVRLAEVVPHARGGRDDVGLVAAVRDHVVRALLRAEMLAPEVPRDVHQLDRIERAAPAPGRAGRVGAGPLEREFGADQRQATPRSPGDIQVVAHVREEHGVHVLEDALANVVRLASELLLGDAGPDVNRARDLLALHDLLDRDRRGDVHRLTGVVSLSMSRRADDHRVLVSHTGLVARLRYVVDVRAQRDDGLRTGGRAPHCNPRRRNADNAPRHGKAVLLEDPGEVPRGLLFLKSELRVAEHLIDHLLREGGHAVHQPGRLRLERGKPGVVSREVHLEREIRAAQQAVGHVTALCKRDCRKNGQHRAGYQARTDVHRCPQKGESDFVEGEGGRMIDLKHRDDNRARSRTHVRRRRQSRVLRAGPAESVARTAAASSGGHRGVQRRRLCDHHLSLGAS